MAEKDYANEGLGTTGKLLIFDVKDGNTKTLASSLERLTSLIEALPERITSAAFLYDQLDDGVRFAMLYIPVDEESAELEAGFETIKSSTKTKTYDDLTVISCTAITEKSNGDDVALYKNAIVEIKKLGIKKLVDISYSTRELDVMNEEATLRLYCK